ncbi:MAG TPA: hypothetical protein VL943_05285, partial [Niabella sp.]|nr:hypothetical protein [Niabella sp.]
SCSSYHSAINTTESTAEAAFTARPAMQVSNFNERKEQPHLVFISFIKKIESAETPVIIRNPKIYANKITIKNILGGSDSYLCKVRLDF